MGNTMKTTKTGPKDHRSAVSGRYITQAQAKANPRESVSERRNAPSTKRGAKR